MTWFKARSRAVQVIIAVPVQCAVCVCGAAGLGAALPDPEPTADVAVRESGSLEVVATSTVAATPVPPTDTAILKAASPVPATEVPPTDTAIPPTEVPHTVTPIPPSDTPVPVSTPTTGPQRTEAQVQRVVDGDQIEVSIEGQPYMLRYIGIDSPEAGTPQGDRAKAENESLVGGQTVYLEKDVSETDPNGRLLRYVYLADGTLVNNRMVRQGFAIAKDYPPDTEYSQRLAKSQAFAEENLRGFWAPDATPETVQETPAAVAVCACAGNLYNCSNFSTHAEAQACYDHCVAGGFGDVHRLDGDNNGSACESLP